VEVKFQLSENDCVALSDYVHQQTPHGRRTARRTWGLGGLLFFVYACLESAHPTHGLHTPQRYAVYMLFSAVLFVPIFAVALWYLRPTITRLDARMGRRRNMLLPTTLHIDRRGLSVSTGRGRGRMAWQAVEDIGSTWDHLFLLTGGGRGIVVPKRAFANRDAYNVFYAALMEYFDEAHRAASGAKAAA
jgi:hypothetical protein